MIALTFLCILTTCHFVLAQNNRLKDAIDKSGVDSVKNSLLLDKVNRLESRLLKLEKVETTLEKYIKAVEPDPSKNYWNNTVGCGGSIIAQNGRIYGSSIFSKMECIWTIQTNHRSWIKISLHQATTSGYYYTKYKEMENCQIKEFDVNFGKFGDSQKFITTKIEADQTYLFHGPLIFLSCLVQSSSDDDFVEFEGFGIPVLENLNFQHHYFSASSGTFNYSLKTVSNFETAVGSSPQLDFIFLSWPGSRGFSENIINLELSNFDNQSVCDFLTFHIYLLNTTGTESAQNDTTILDCCEVNCSKYKFVINNEHFLATIGVNRNQMTGTEIDVLKFSWEIREHSSSRYKSIYHGNIISGEQVGQLRKNDYTNNERCIWTIHPFPKTDIELNGTVLLEDIHDQITVVELLENGQIQTTKLVMDHISLQSYSFHGRVVFVMFYADKWRSKGSFNFKWRSSPGYNLSNLMLDDKFYSYKTIHGHEIWDISMKNANITRPGKHVILLNPDDLAPDPLDLKIRYKVQGNAILTVFGSENFIFQTYIVSNGTMDWVHENLTSSDSVFIIVANILDETSEIMLEANWTRAGGNDTSITHYEECGGTIVGHKTAIISYKPETNLSSFERCSWLILCPYSEVAFKLLKQQLQGTLSNNDILIETIDLANGKIKTNSTLTIKLSNHSYTVDGPMIIVSFQSNSNRLVKNYGFVLEFDGSGDFMDVEQKYRLVHSLENEKEFAYATEEIKEELIVLAYNHDYKMVPYAKQLSVVVNFFKHYMNANNVEYNHQLVLYGHSHSNNFEEKVECIFMQGNISQDCTFSKDFHQVPWTSEEYVENFQMVFNYSSFLATIKPFTQHIDGHGNSSFSLMWEEDVAGKCGGSIFAHTGTISYKLLEKYDAYERCLWVVRTSMVGHNALTFLLESSGMEENIDVVSVTAVELNSGTLGISTTLSLDSQTNISSPVALVTFYSDSSVEGYGFHLSFYSFQEDDENSTSKLMSVFPQFSRNLSGSSEMLISQSSSLGPNDTSLLVIAPYRRLTYRRYSGTLHISLTNLHLFLNENCNSDSLFVYKFSGTFILDKSFRSYKNSNSICNDTTENIDQDEVSLYDEDLNADLVSTCNSECSQTNVLTYFDSNIIKSYHASAPLVILYKSVSAKHLKRKFQIEWTDKTDSD